MKTDSLLAILLFVGAAFVLFVWWMGGCCMRSGPPVDPNYPSYGITETRADAGTLFERR